MQLPTIDRTPNVRPAGADLASPSAGRVVPVAPINPPVRSVTPIEPTPGVVDMVNPALKIQEAKTAYPATPDPVRRADESATAPKDWTIHRLQPEKVENPPPKPISQVLMDHLKTVWTASASAIQIEQVKNQMQPDTQIPPPSEAPGELAKQVLTYTPSTVKKTENL